MTTSLTAEGEGTMDDKGFLALTTVQPAFCFQIAQHGEMLATVRFDGTLVYGPNYDPDQASRIFWEYIARYIPRQLVELGAQLAAVTKEHDDAAELAQMLRADANELVGVLNETRKERDDAVRLLTALCEKDDWAEPMTCDGPPACLWCEEVGCVEGKHPCADRCRAKELRRE